MIFAEVDEPLGSGCLGTREDLRVDMLAELLNPNLIEPGLRRYFDISVIGFEDVVLLELT